MKILITRLFNQTGEDTGARLAVATPSPISARQKLTIENELVQYAFDNIYPDEPLSIYREFHSDMPAITVIKGVEDLPKEEVNTLEAN